MGFFGGLFTGAAPGLDKSIANSNDIMNFGTKLGEKDIKTGSDFYNALLSGDPTAIGRILGPEFSDIQKQGQQQIQTQGEFGNRSGGTNASNQQNIDTQRANVERMISQLTGQAAQGVTGIGENALNAGITADQLQAQQAEQKLQHQINSLFSKMISGGMGALESIGIGSLVPPIG
jgi:hypothetical protein